MKKLATSESARILALGLCSVGVFLALLGFGAFSGLAQGANQDQGTSQLQVGASYHNDVSRPMRDMPPWTAGDVRRTGEREANENPKIPYRHVDGYDPVVQNFHAPALHYLAPNVPLPIRNFDGIGFPGVGCSCPARHEWGGREHAVCPDRQRRLSGL